MTSEDKSDLKKLLFYMESDPKMGHIGIAERLELFEKRLDSIEGRHKVIYRVGIILGGVATFAVGKSWVLIKALF